MSSSTDAASWLTWHFATISITVVSPSLISALCFFPPVFESFKDYVATEQLDGDNKYDAGEHGLQVRLHTDWILIIYVVCSFLFSLILFCDI